MKNKKQLKKIPNFKNSKQEQDFWKVNDSADFIDWSQARDDIRFPNLKPTSKTISLRLPVGMLDQLKILANKKDIPYQSFMKVLLDRGIQSEN